MEPTGPASVVRLPPPSSLGSGLPMLPLPAGFGPASNGKTFAPTRIFPALPSPSPNLLAHIPLEVSGDAKQVATPALSSPPPAPPASSWVLYNSAQADSKRRKVARTQFTEEQKTILNHYFTQRNHMKNYKPLEIKDIERETGLTEHQIRIYFQNKRARTKAKQGSGSVSPQPQSPPTRYGAIVAPTPVMPPTTELPQLRDVLPSPLKRKEPSPAPPSPPQAPLGTRSSASAFAIAPHFSPPNRLNLLAPASAAVGDISASREAGPTQTQLNTLKMIDSIATRMGLVLSDAAQAKELMCGVFDGKHVPRAILEHAAGANLIAASCLHIARRQNLRPLPIAAFEESLGLPQGLLNELVEHIIGGMRLILNDVDATQYIAKALMQLELPDNKLAQVRTAALTVLDAAKRSEQQSILRNPAALAAAALLIGAKKTGVPLAYAATSSALKVCQWSVRSKEDELTRLLNF